MVEVQGFRGSMLRVNRNKSQEYGRYDNSFLPEPKKKELKIEVGKAKIRENPERQKMSKTHLKKGDSGNSTRKSLN